MSTRFSAFFPFGAIIEPDIIKENVLKLELKKRQLDTWKVSSENVTENFISFHRVHHKFHLKIGPSQIFDSKLEPKKIPFSIFNLFQTKWKKLQNIGWILKSILTYWLNLSVLSKVIYAFCDSSLKTWFDYRINREFTFQPM